jgi:hypothetical protein
MSYNPYQEEESGYRPATAQKDSKMYVTKWYRTRTRKQFDRNEATTRYTEWVGNKNMVEGQSRGRPQQKVVAISR